VHTHTNCCDLVVHASSNHPLPCPYLLHYFKIVAYQDDLVPTLEDMRMLRGNERAWEFICDELLPAVVGTTIWEQQSVSEEVSKFVTVSDVAFCLLTVENNWTYWVDIAAPDLDKDNENEHDKPKIPGDTKWTSSTLVAGKNTGWSQEGLQRFNELCKLEAENRLLYGSVEKQYLKKKKEKNAIAQNKSKRDTRVDHGVETYVDEASLDW